MLRAPEGCFHGRDVAAMKTFKSMFPTVLRDSGKSKKRHWGANKTENEMSGEESNKRARTNTGPTLLKSAATATVDFAAVLTKAKEEGDTEIWSKLFREMKGIIEKSAFAREDAGEDETDGVLLMALLTALRKGALDAFDVPSYNSFARAFRARCAKDHASDMWSFLLQSGNGLITKKEAEENDNVDGVGVEQSEAEQFLTLPLVSDDAAPKQDAVNVSVDLAGDDDMDMDDLE